MKKGVVAFISILFFAAVVLSTFGCAPDAGKIYKKEKESKTQVENEQLKERIAELEGEVDSLKKELKNCLERRIESLGPDAE
jgi:hypothetical protein